MPVIDGTPLSETLHGTLGDGIISGNGSGDAVPLRGVVDTAGVTSAVDFFRRNDLE